MTSPTPPWYTVSESEDILDNQIYEILELVAKELQQIREEILELKLGMFPKPKFRSSTDRYMQDDVCRSAARILISELPKFKSKRHPYIKTFEILNILNSKDNPSTDALAAIQVLCGLLDDQLPGVQQLGLLLRSLMNKVIDGKQLQRVYAHSRVAVWRVVEIT